MSAGHPDEENLTRLAVIGCGRLSTSRIFPCFPRLPVRLVGVCDLNESAARRNARRHGGEAVYTNAEKMLDETRPDGVVICIGPAMHAKLGIMALQRGIPVYTEKPPAPSAREAWAVAEAARKAGKACMTAFKYRYAPAMVEARRIVQSPEFGGVHALSLYRVSGPYKNDPADERSRFLLDFCIHPIDEVLFLGGPVAEVHTMAAGRDGYAVGLRFASGGVGAMTLSCHGSWGAPIDRTEVTGAPGHVLRVRDQIFLRYEVDGQPRQVHEPRFCTAGGDSLKETGFLPELGAFVEHLRGKREAEDLPSHIVEATRSMALYEAIERSARSGKPEKPERFE